MKLLFRMLPLAAAVALPAVVCAADAKPNVLLIVADDLRTELGCYGSQALTPNLDRLAARGLRFERAYCQQALCNPSRSSMLCGLRPDTLGLWVNGLHFRELNPRVVTLPEFFKRHGYVTRDVGKIFHNWHTQAHGDRQSWSAPEFLHYANHGDDKPMVDGAPPADGATAPKCERRDVPDEAYFDGRVAAEAVRVMKEIKDGPFFLAVGFWKPHAPFNAPAKYWNLYDRAKLPPLDPRRPTDAPEIAFHDGREIRGIPPNQVTFTPAEAAEIRHGYYAGTSYMDAQVGKVLAELDALGLRESTVVVFCADHGYHLGEHGLWCKTSNFERDARVPLIVAPPKFARGGTRSAALVELLDVYPTLVDLCGLPAATELEGRSLAAVLADPTAAVKEAAYTQHPRPSYPDRTEKGVPDAMGYSVRTARYRYTEWRDWESGRVVGRELYDHATDPDELTNAIAAPADPAAAAAAQRQLHERFPSNTAPVARVKRPPTAP